MTPNPNSSANATANARVKAKATIVPIFAVAAALLVTGTAFVLSSRPVAATTAYAAATGQPCAACHVQPDGGPDLTDFGKAFQANGNKLPPP
jgi:mono/diheme cytochrome c family protein